MTVDQKIDAVMFTVMSGEKPLAKAFLRYCVVDKALIRARLRHRLEDENELLAGSEELQDFGWNTAMEETRRAEDWEENNTKPILQERKTARRHIDPIALDI